MLTSVTRNLVYSDKNCLPYSKWELIADYAKIVGLRGLSKFRRKHQQHLSVFNVKFWFPNLSRFIYLLTEIFLKQDYFFTSAKPDPVIIDCGSNIGVSILYFKRKYPRARVTGFEPDPAIFGFLQKNVAANKWSDVTLHNCALSDREGETELFCESNLAGSLRGSLRKDRTQQDVESKTVKTVLLSNYVRGDVDFLKIDIEGMEMAVIEDLEREGKLSRVREMAIEYHHHVPAGDDSLSRLLAILETNGFGYRIGASVGWPVEDKRDMQDILVRAYRK
jgi:FkbM family methyltransferase